MFEPAIGDTYEFVPGYKVKCIEGDDCINCLAVENNYLCERIHCCTYDGRSDGKRILIVEDM